MAATTTVAIPAHAAPHAPTGVMSWLTTVDHKKVGIMYFWVSFSFFLV